MSRTQKQITILFKGRRVVSLHRPESLSATATATATAPSNDDVKTKHSHIHSEDDVRKRPRDEHIHHQDEQPDLKRRPAAPPSATAATAHPVVVSANDDVRTTKHLKEQQPDLKKSTTTYKVGEQVEVRSDEEGFKGAWYPATISAALGGDRYAVKYRTLLTDDEEKLLREETRSKYIRPRRPRIRERGLEIQDKVDAWFNDGWWEGHITERLPDRKWCVYFEAYNEEMAFSDSQLRLSLKWVNGRWVRPSKSTNNTARPRTGTKIGVGH